MPLPSIGGNIIGQISANGTLGGNMYKNVPVTKNKDIYIKHTLRKKKVKTEIDNSVLIQLGGVFEVIGDDEERVGGGDQKIG